MNNNQYCVIMAGGYGNMFWPISRKSRPKHFLDILDENITFLGATYSYCQAVVPQDNILVITSAEFKDTVKKQLPMLKDENLLLEPYGKKTAPCVAYSTYEILRRNDKAVIAMTPVDLIVWDKVKFVENLTATFEYAAQNPVLMTIGIKPTRPDSNYGYIQITGGRAEFKDKPVKVKTFTEKPPVALAEIFCKSGEFFWNSGIFVWQGSVIKEELEKFLPEVTGLFNGWQYALGSAEQDSFIQRVYTDCPKISIDYGVMEKTDKAWMFFAQFDWCDIDTWDSYYTNYRVKDKDGNITNCEKKHFDGNKKSMILSRNKEKMYAIKGLENYIVVDTADVLLICPKDDEAYNDFMAKGTNTELEDYK